MKLVLDTNILISSLINPEGKIASIILNPYAKYEFYSCYFMYMEIFKYKEKLLKLSKLQENDFLELLYYIIKKITFINEENIPNDVWRSAFELTKDVDEKDTPFVALSIFLDSYFWTGDKKLIEGLTKKNFDRFLTTSNLEILEEEI